MGMKGSAITKIYIQNGAMILIEVPRVLSLSSCLWKKELKGDLTACHISQAICKYESQYHFAED